MRLAFVTLIGLLLSVPAAAQPSPDGRPGAVRIVVRDITDLPLAAAQVALIASDGTAIRSATNDRGEASFGGLRAGVYSVRVEAVGFAPLALDAVAVAAGSRVTREVTLQVAGYVERVEVTPSPDDRELMNAFTEQLTDDQRAALPEDPEELALVLRQLVGDGAEIRVNGFRRDRLPLGSQIRDIRIRRDPGGASTGDGPRIDIATVPGDGWRNNVFTSVEDEAWNSRNAFSPERPVGRTQEYAWNLEVPLVRDQTGLSMGIEGSRSMENQVIRAAVPGGFYSSLIQQPTDAFRFWMGLEHQISPAQSIRVDLTRNVNDARNQGLGELDLPEHAFASKGSGTELEIAHHVTLGGGAVNDVRFTMTSNSTALSSVSGSRTIRVLDAFTSGGAQQWGGSRSRIFQLEDNLEFALRKRHQITVGVNAEGTISRSDASSNALGTYVFESLDAFQAGRPSTFVQRVGDPAQAYSMYRFGWQVRDDYPVRRNLLLNLGLRNDFETHLSDRVNLSPRMGINWTPFPKSRTTLRASVLVFHSPLTAGMYGQMQLLNGLSQSDLVITDPGYPDPFSAGAVEALPPPSIIRAGADLEMPVSRRDSIGVDQPIGRFLRLRGTWSHEVGRHLFRSRDANAPVNGVRPDPSVLSVTELESTARSVSQSLRTELSVTYPRRRLSANVAYTLGRALDETDWPFLLPPDSFDLSGEWGPARSDVRHRLDASVISDLPGGFRVNASFRAQSGLPFNITAGTDANGDGVYNERPAGVTRNTERGAGSTNLDLTVTWRVSRSRSRAVGEAPSEATVARAGVRNPDVFRFEVFLSATNVLNAINPQNFSGVMTSPFFGLPTSAAPARRFVIGTQAWF
jgi:hypothetical protein